MSFQCSCDEPLEFDEDGLSTCPNCGRVWRVNDEKTGMSPVEKEEPVK